VVAVGKVSSEQPPFQKKGGCRGNIKDGEVIYNEILNKLYN
jgi:hypothetical protein